MTELFNDLLLRGLALGFAIAAPVGAIGMLCIRRTLADGRAAGLATGMGAASADACYGAIAGLGLTAISAFLLGHEREIRVVGGVFLLYLGIEAFRSRPPEMAQEASGSTLLRAWGTTFLLTLTNPMTVISFTAAFVSLGLVQVGGEWVGAVKLVLGVFLGSTLWWLVLTTGVSLLRPWVTPERMAWVNRISGVIIAGFGVLALVSVVR